MLITEIIAGSPVTMLQSATPKAPTAIPMEPEISNGLRPHFSTVNTASKVNRIFTTPMSTVCTIGLAIPIVSNIRGAKYSTALIPTACWNTLNMMPMKITIQPYVNSFSVFSSVVAFISARITLACDEPLIRLNTFRAFSSLPHMAR